MYLNVDFFQKGDYILVNGDFYIVKDLKFDDIHKDILYCHRIKDDVICIININCVRSIDFVYDENFYICNVKKNRKFLDNKKVKKYTKSEVIQNLTSYNI